MSTEEQIGLNLLNFVLSKLEQICFRIELPFCEFNNLKDSKKSISNIINMPIKSVQRIAFKIYDRNGNGVIDENDIIQLFLIAEESPSMQSDIEVIVKNYKIGGKKSNNLEGTTTDTIMEDG